MSIDYHEMAVQNKGITALNGAGRVENSVAAQQNTEELKASQHRSWAYDIAEYPERFGAISLQKASCAFSEWGLPMPNKLSSHIKTIGLKL